MTEMTLADLAGKIAEIDITMLITHSDGGALAGRPMSNNRDVEYDGDSYYFTWADSRMVRDIRADPKVALTLQGAKSFLGAPGIQISIGGTAELIQDKDVFRKHWQPDLQSWFKQGVDTPGLMLIKVRAARIHYWDGDDEGELLVD